MGVEYVKISEYYQNTLTYKLYVHKIHYFI